MKQTILPQNIFITLNDSREMNQQKIFETKFGGVQQGHHMVNEIILCSSSYLKKRESINAFLVNFSIQNFHFTENKYLS